MKKWILLVILSVSMTASAGIFDGIGKDLSLAFGQCPKDKQARVEVVLNNTDLTKATIIRDGQRPFKLYTKNNKKGLLALCEKDAANLSINQVLSGISSSFYCGNKVYTCNVVTISTSGGGSGDDDDKPVVITPLGDDDDSTPPVDDDDSTTPPDDDDSTLPDDDDGGTTPPDDDGDTPNPVEDL